MTHEARDGAAVKIFPPGIPLAAIIVSALLQRFYPLEWSSYLPVVPTWVGWTTIVGALVVFGLWPVTLFRRSGQNENPWKPTPAIVDYGPYRITRNPMYLQMVLLCLGFSFTHANLWLLASTPLTALALQWAAIMPEEAYLAAKFGQQYEDYKQRVRRWL